MDFSAWNRTVEAIYAAAAAPNLWPETLQGIADVLDARGALLLYQHDDGRYGVIVSPKLTALVQEYQKHWQHLDVRAERLFQSVALGQRDVHADHTLFTDEEIATLPIYQQFLLPHGMCWSMAVPVSPAPAINVMLSLLRSRDKPAFSEALQDQLLAVSRHVERSLSLSIRLMDAEAERVGLSAAFDRLDCGVFILGVNQQVLLTNGTAERFLGSGLVLSAGRLRVLDRTAQQAFQAQIEAVESGQTAEIPSLRPLVVPDGERGLIAQVVPLSAPAGMPALLTARAVVLVERPTDSRPFDPVVVRDAFRLTLGEARLAALIGAGTSPSDAAATLGITDHTARSVLKRVFEKMGVSRQSELAALMGQLFMLRRHVS